MFSNLFTISFALSRSSGSSSKASLITVKNGFGRNFLLKQGKALRFNKENLDLVNKKKDELNKKNLELKVKFKDIAKLVNNKTFNFNKESKYFRKEESLGK